MIYADTRFAGLTNFYSQETHHEFPHVRGTSGLKLTPHSNDNHLSALLISMIRSFSFNYCCRSAYNTAEMFGSVHLVP